MGIVESTKPSRASGRLLSKSKSNSLSSNICIQQLGESIKNRIMYLTQVGQKVYIYSSTRKSKDKLYVCLPEAARLKIVIYKNKERAGAVAQVY